MRGMHTPPWSSPGSDWLRHEGHQEGLACDPFLSVEILHRSKLFFNAHLGAHDSLFAVCYEPEGACTLFLMPLQVHS